MTTKLPTFGPLDATIVVVGAFVQTVLIRVGTGLYPPLWAAAVIGGLTGAAWAVGATAAHRQARR